MAAAVCRITRLRNTDFRECLQPPSVLKFSLGTNKKATAVVLIKQAFKNCKKITRDSQKDKTFNVKMREFMALDDQPFCVVEEQGFHQRMAHLEAG